jgi:hypothetical protein
MLLRFLTTQNVLVLTLAVPRLCCYELKEPVQRTKVGGMHWRAAYVECHEHTPVDVRAI